MEIKSPEFLISGKKINLNRPLPLTEEMDVLLFNKRDNQDEVIDAILDNQNVLVTDYYSSGMLLLNVLKKRLEKKFNDTSFTGQRAFRSEFRKRSHQILVEIENNKLLIKKAPLIGWLKQLYPDVDTFLLPFPQVQGLNSAWQWYEKGLKVPGLNKRIHPYYGVYFPTRFEHIMLFEHWLNQYKGNKNLAMDIGVGSGILSLLLLQNGFNHVIATDSNPNAIIGLYLAFKESEMKEHFSLNFVDLFAEQTEKSDLIVFNPPWLPAEYSVDGIDQAIYYESDLFPKFFKEASKQLNPNGLLVLIFSNLAQISFKDIEHPIINELKLSGRFKKLYYTQKKVAIASKKTKRLQNHRSKEMVELWVLKLNDQIISV